MDMQANGGIAHPDHNSPRAHTLVASIAGPPPQRDDILVHELNEARMNALRLIDEGGFSCVAISRALIPPPCSPRAVAVGFI